ncbi:MAG: tetratricopeptide repeat protein, partial [Propylenella sp.]
MMGFAPLRFVILLSLVLALSAALSGRWQAHAQDPEADAKRSAQEQLQTLGLYRGALDGVYGPGTYAAWEKFARAADMSPDSNETMTFLFDAASVSRAKGVGLQEAIRLARTLPEARALAEQGGREVSAARYSEAEALYQRALAIREAALGREHPDVAAVLSSLSRVYLATGRSDGAMALCERALAIQEAALGRDHPDLAKSLNCLAYTYSFHRRYNEAIPLYERALAILEPAIGRDHPDIGTLLTGLADAYRAMYQLPEAIAALERALAIREAALGPNHPDLATSLDGLASVHLTTGHTTEALPLYERALAIQEEAFGRDDPRVALTLNRMALL